MLISGRDIAQRILLHLKKRVERLQSVFDLTPSAAVIRIGSDQAIDSYVSQKKIIATKIGAELTVYQFSENIEEAEVLAKIDALQKENTVQGIILQLPIPKHLDQEKILKAIDPKFDIDGFDPDSKFPVPLAQAVIEILREIHFLKDPLEEVPFVMWLQSRNITVIGKGSTGGKPVIDLLKRIGLSPSIIDSKTKNSHEIIREADIIISCVGKKNLITKNMLKEDVILIGVGMNKDANGKFFGDYEENDIKDIASYYTPLPGGVGPVNVAKLMENLVDAAESTIKN